MLVFAEVVEADKLIEVVWVSLLAGVGVTAVYSTAIAGIAAFTDARREGRTGLAVAAGIVAGVAILLFLATVVFGVLVMTQK